MTPSSPRTVARMLDRGAALSVVGHTDDFEPVYRLSWSMAPKRLCYLEHDSPRVIAYVDQDNETTHQDGLDLLE